MIPAMRWQDHIERQPGVMGGKPVIRGTRITVELVLQRLAAGATDADLIEAFPDVRRDDVRAAQGYAASALAADEWVLLDTASR